MENLEKILRNKPELTIQFFLGTIELDYYSLTFDHTDHVIGIYTSQVNLNILYSRINNGYTYNEKDYTLLIVM